MKRVYKRRKNLTLILCDLDDIPDDLVEDMRTELQEKGMSKSLKAEGRHHLLPETVLARLFHNQSMKASRDSVMKFVEDVYKKHQVAGKPFVIIMDNPSIYVGMTEKLPDSLQEYKVDLDNNDKKR